MVAAADGRFRLVGTISVAFGCPFEGKVDPGVVLSDMESFARAVEVPLRVRLGRRDEQAQLVRSVASVEIGDGTLDRLHVGVGGLVENPDRKSTRLNSGHVS